MYEDFLCHQRQILTNSQSDLDRLRQENGANSGSPEDHLLRLQRRTGERFGFHNFRHSLSSFLTTKKKTDPKTATAALRQSNVAFTLNKYAYVDNEELIAAQNLMLEAIFQNESGAIQ